MTLIERRRPDVIALERMHRDHGPRRGLDARRYMEVFDSLADAIVVVDDAGCVVAYNDAARDLLGALVDRPALRCCNLLPCGRTPDERPAGQDCVTAAVIRHGGLVDGLEFDLDGQRGEAIATPLGGGLGAVLQFRAADRRAARSLPVPPLRITTLGSMQIECEGADLGGEWLDHRPGQLLKYLVCARGQRVPVDELVDALWPDSRRAGLTSLRKAVHGLRERLEPGRPKQAASRFVVARPNAYELDMANVVVDADLFEKEAVAALLTLERSGGEEAEAQLARAADMYTGEFLADEPFADWALAQRDRLRDLAARVLRELARNRMATGDLASAASALRRLADLEPLDLDVQRELISLLLRSRRHAEAARRYNLVRHQFRRAFGQDPDFALSDLVQHSALAA